jgi:folate-binding Fe-S cluster repair protein YgfZ
MCVYVCMYVCVCVCPRVEQSVVIEVHASQASAVQQYLTLYKLRSKVKISSLQGQYKVRIAFL